MSSKIIRVNLNEPDNCPFRSDLNTCKAVPMSSINFCPECVEVPEDVAGMYRYVAPFGCPLRENLVMVLGLELAVAP